MLPRELRSKNPEIVIDYINKNLDSFRPHQILIIRKLLSDLDLSDIEFGPYLSVLDESKQLEAINYNGYAIKWIKNPSKKVKRWLSENY